MTALRSAAIEKALTAHPIIDAAEWIGWVQATPQLTDVERDLVLTATADDLRATAVRIKSEVDRQRAELSATDALLEGLRPWLRDEQETFGEMLDRVAAEDPDEHRRLMALARLAFPTGYVTVPVEVAG